VKLTTPKYQGNTIMPTGYITLNTYGIPRRFPLNGFAYWQCPNCGYTSISFQGIEYFCEQTPEEIDEMVETASQKLLDVASDSELDILFNALHEIASDKYSLTDNIIAIAREAIYKDRD
jgi:hypothetical protein